MEIEKAAGLIKCPYCQRNISCVLVLQQLKILGEEIAANTQKNTKFVEKRTKEVL